MSMKRRIWTEEEVQFLHDNHSTMSVENISKEINWTPKKVQSKLSRIGLPNKNMCEHHKKLIIAEQLIKQGCEFKDIVKEVGLRISRIHKLNYKMERERLNKPKPAVFFSAKIHYWENEDEIMNSFNPKYAYNELSETEKEIYNEC